MMPEVDRKHQTSPKHVTSKKSSVAKMGDQPVADNPQQRLKWIAHLEFAQSHSVTKGILTMLL